MNVWGWNPGMMHWGYGGFMVMIVILVVLVVGVVFLFRWAGSNPGERLHDGTANTKKTAEQILDERYARGEITREEYLQIKDDLEGNQEHTTGGSV